MNMQKIAIIAVLLTIFMSKPAVSKSRLLLDADLDDNYDEFVSDGQYKENSFDSRLDTLYKSEDPESEDLASEEDINAATVHSNKIRILIDKIDGFKCPVFDFDYIGYGITDGQRFEGKPSFDLIGGTICGGHVFTIRAGRKKSKAVRVWFDKHGDLTTSDQYVCTMCHGKVPSELNFAIRLDNFRIRDRENPDNVRYYGTVVIGQGSTGVWPYQRNNWWIGSSQLRRSPNHHCMGDERISGIQGDSPYFRFTTDGECKYTNNRQVQLGRVSTTSLPAPLVQKYKSQDPESESEDMNVATVHNNKINILIGNIAGFSCPVFDFDYIGYGITDGQKFEGKPSWDLIDGTICGGHTVTIRAGRKKSGAVRQWFDRHGDLTTSDQYIPTKSHERVPSELNFAIRLDNFRIRDRNNPNNVKNYGTVVIGQGSQSGFIYHYNNWWIASSHIRSRKCLGSEKITSGHPDGEAKWFKFQTSSEC